MQYLGKLAILPGREGESEREGAHQKDISNVQNKGMKEDFQHKKEMLKMNAAKRPVKEYVHKSAKGSRGTNQG